MKYQKKLLTLICCFAMGLSLLTPISIQAAELEPSGEEQRQEEAVPSESEDSLAESQDSSETVESPETTEWPELSGWTLGSSEYILNGGYLVMSESSSYYVDRGNGALYCEGSTAPLAEGEIRNLNVCGDTLYFSRPEGGGSAICRVQTDGSGLQQLYLSPQRISQLYVVSGERAYFLTEDGIFATDFRVPGVARPIREQAGIRSFIPTPRGMIYATGELFSYSLYADDRQIDSGIFSYYSYDSMLIYVKGDETYQAELDSLFEAMPRYVVETYQDTSFFSGEELALDTLEVEETSPLMRAVKEVAPDQPISYPALGISALKSATERQANIVKRARQQFEVVWTPQQDILGWRGAYLFKAGVTYHGVPYGQPVYAAYVPWTDAETNAPVSFADFRTAVADVNSKMYTKCSTYNQQAPYYSSDCSSFISYAWNLSVRQWTGSLSSFSDKVASQSIFGAQVGDVFLYAGAHVTLISDIGYDNAGNVLYVDILEQTDPIVKHVRYGGDSTKTLEELNRRFFVGGYTLYRLKSDQAVPYTHDCAVPLQGESCSVCKGVPVDPVVQPKPPVAPGPQDKTVVSYSTHMQTTGWSSWAANGLTSGNLGSGKRLEAFNVKLTDSSYTGDVLYRAYVQNSGWGAWQYNGKEAGTTGKALRAEAVEIKLSGQIAEHYDIYYRTYLADAGWLSWVKNGETSGAGAGRRLEGIQIRLVAKDGSISDSIQNSTDTSVAPVTVRYQPHVQTYGWMTPVVDQATAGTTGQAKRLEALKIWVDSTADLGVEYMGHCQSYGWLSWQRDGSLSGTTGLAKRMEAVRIRLTGRDADKYDIYYQVHSQTYGWLDWAKNGEVAGTTGLAKRMEAIKIVVVPKGQAAPGATARPSYQK